MTGKARVMTYQHSTFFPMRCENLRSIEQAVEHVKKVLKQSLAQSSKSEQETYHSLLVLMIAAWTEARLSKLLEEWNAFTPLELEVIKMQESHTDKWLRVIKLSFSKHYQVPEATLNETTLGREVFKKYTFLREIIERDIKPITEIRNKIAHGEWMYFFNSKGTGLNAVNKALLDSENYLTLNFKQQMIQHFCSLIHDLATSKKTFERDFELNLKKLMDVKSRLKNHDFQVYVIKERQNYIYGQAARNNDRPT